MEVSGAMWKLLEGWQKIVEVDGGGRESIEIASPKPNTTNSSILLGLLL